jgi:hypothetical protein
LLGVLFGPLGVTEAITPEQYAEGYRRCENYVERARPIDLIVSVLTEAVRGARWPGAGPALAMIGRPARQAGWVELYDFLKRGHEAFKHIKDVKAFVGTIEARERRILAQIFSGEPEPFAI